MATPGAAPMANRRGLRVALVAATIGVVAACGLFWMENRGPQLAPDFAVSDLSGQAIRLSALRGKVVLVNLWTTWCPPCREEMPSMQRLYERLKDRDFQLLAVSQDEDGRRVVEPFVKEMRLSFPVLIDPEHQVGERYGVWGYPETFVIDRSGRIAERVIGPRDWASPASISSLEGLIAQGDGGASPAAPRGPS
jgi:cytochrome c biogenesis protein CcmG/thiol:disulfide interchange protein DsbE